MRVTHKGLTVEFDEKDSDSRVAAALKAMSDGASVFDGAGVSEHGPQMGTATAVATQPMVVKKTVAAPAANKPEKKFPPVVKTVGTRQVRGPGWVGGSISVKEHLDRDTKVKAFMAMLWKFRAKPDGVHWKEALLEICGPAAVKAARGPDMLPFENHARAYAARLDMDWHQIWRKDQATYFGGPQIAVFVKRAFNVNLAST